MDDNWLGALALEKVKHQSRLPLFEEVSNNAANTTSAVDRARMKEVAVAATCKDDLEHHEERHAFK